MSAFLFKMDTKMELQIYLKLNLQLSLKDCQTVFDNLFLAWQNRIHKLNTMNLAIKR